MSSMDSDGAMRRWTDPYGRVTTFCYDAGGPHSVHSGPVPLPATDAMCRLTNLTDCEPGRAEAQRPAAAGTPIVTHSFEFRLSGSEGMEQALPLDFSKIPRTGLIVAIRSVQTYLTRQGEPAAATSAIADVEVHAELRDSGVYCTAQLSEFGAGDLVVVRVEVAVY